MRRRNNSQEVLQNTDCMCMGNAICSLRKNLNSLHGPIQQSHRGMEIQAYMCYTARARKAFGTLALAPTGQLCQKCERLSAASMCFAGDYEFVCMVNLRVVTGRTMRA